MNLSYIDNDGILHRVRDTDTGNDYFALASQVEGGSAAVEWVRNYGINRRQTIASGTKTKITYDTYGIVTSGTNATTADIDDTPNRRYVTDAQLNGIGKSVTSIAQMYANTAISSGLVTVATIALVAPEPSLAYTVKAWFKAAATQNHKRITAAINGNPSYEVLNHYEKFDNETFSITIEGICDSVTATTQGWVSSVISLNANANHSLITATHLTGCSVANISLFADTIAASDLTLIGYSSYYCKL